MAIIGRKEEKQILEDILRSKRPEFLVLYGRRRIGKTFLIKEFFNEDFTFYVTGVPNISPREKLKIFNIALKKYGSNNSKVPSDWLEAFERLEELLESDSIKRNAESGKRIIFIDELPWLDGQKSSFKAALDLFWNSYASTKNDIVLIVCGSATSWIIDNLISDKGGFHNRLTRRIHLMPFTLLETKELLLSNGLQVDNNDVIQYYMVFGGVPFYLNLLSYRLSISQNIDSLLFKENGQLFNEFNELFSSLFKKHENHLNIILKLAEKKAGMTRQELAEDKKIISGLPLTKALKELEECGFIRHFSDYKTPITRGLYQLVDPLTNFYINFLKEKKFDSWILYFDSPRYYSWRGRAFEIVIFNHINHVKSALGISGIQSKNYSFSSREKKNGAQIDLLIDRNDGIINLCEMKFTNDKFEIDSNYRATLLNKIKIFKEESKTKSKVFLTFITNNGVLKNSNSDIVINEVLVDELF